MKIEELRQAIETYPQRLQTLLRTIEKAESLVEKLQEQIDEEETILTLPEDAPTEEAEPDENSHQQKQLRIDHELALLQLNYDRLRGETELEYRRNPPKGDKVTEATVSAYIKSHPQLLEAKQQCLTKEVERKSLDFSRRLEYRAERRESRMVPAEEPPTSPKLEKLRTRFFAASLDVTEARISLKGLKSELKANRLLVQLYVAGLIK